MANKPIIPEQEVLNALGLCTFTMLNFDVDHINGLVFSIAFETRYHGLLRPKYVKTELGVFRCVCPGGVNPDGSPVVMCLGCPAHTPRRCWKVITALVEWARINVSQREKHLKRFLPKEIWDRYPDGLQAFCKASQMLPLRHDTRPRTFDAATCSTHHPSH